MPIYRGDGGSAETSNNATVNGVAQDAAEAAASAAAAAASATAAAASATAASASETAAETAETNAENAETNAADSATSAADSATAALSSAASAVSSETNAASSATAASGSATAAANSATAASTSETNAATSATNAATSETNASNSASAAATSATNAATSETNAATSETNAATSATNAATSAGAAGLAETNAVNAQAAAAGSATAAATSATNAATSETNAATSATNAATSETNAANSATAAATSATNAATSETNAANSATAAATSATNAATSETNAATSATSAATSATNAAASYDDFDDRYLGAKASDPSVDNDGDALLTGALYFNTTSNAMKVYTGSAWNEIADTLDSLTDVTITSVSNGQVLKYNGSAWVNAADAGGIALTDLSVTQNAVGTAALSYDNTTGVFSYTPPDLSGYMPSSFQESDPVFSASPANGITSINITNWNTAYGWGNHASAGYWKKGADIGGSVNLNTYTTPGFYHQNANANAASGSNYPVAAAGMLEVTSDGLMVYQRYTQYNNGQIYTRSYYNGTWYSWYTVWDSRSFTSTNIANWNTAYTEVNAATSSNVGDAIVRRTASGDIFVRYGYSSYLNMSHAVATRSSDTVFYSSNDNFIRKNNASGMRSALGVAALSGATFTGLIITDDNTTTTFNSANDKTISVRSNGTAPAAMSFHRPGAYAVNFGLDGSNMKLGGWSAVSTKFLWEMSNGNFHADGNVIAYSTSVSDERFKDDVQPITGALDTVDALQGVTFTWNAGSREGQRDYGLIAQEVEKVLPEVVHESAMPLMTNNDNDTLYKTIDYDKLVSVLINAVSELRAEVEALKNGSSK